MYKIEPKNYGFKLTFADTVTLEEMHKWLDESIQILKTAQKEFGIFVDMRTLLPLKPDVQKIMVEGQAVYKRRGMLKSVVILNNTILTMQFRRLAVESGIDKTEKYIDASSTPDWEKRGVDWLEKGINPDK